MGRPLTWQGTKSDNVSRVGGQAFEPDVSLERLTYPRVLAV